MTEWSEGLELSDSSDSEVRGIVGTGSQGLSASREAAVGLLGDWA